MIVLTRIDGRLIHGQVTVGYTRRYSADTIIVANDYLADSSFEKSLLKMAAPTGVEIEILSLDETAKKIKEDGFEGSKVLLLVKSPVDFVELVEKGCSFEKVNVGGVINEGADIKLTKEVMATKEELEAWKKINEMGIKMELQWEVSKNITNFNNIISKAAD
ncbi:PTS sugar transporter subunit IIB [bacterium]|nr:PTS sugar transporter subunit IIB [bacterium]